MIVSIHQPAYLPWLGYFDKIIRSDIFVYLDTVQFEKNSFQNRNKIKTSQGAAWLTIPVLHAGHTSNSLLDTLIDERQKWKKKHLLTIYHAYKSAPRFKLLYPKVEELYAEDVSLFSDFCWKHLLFWLGEMGMSNKQLVRSSRLHCVNKKSDLVLEICERLNAHEYLSGKLGADYLEIDTFKEKNITVNFQEYCSPVYPQLHGEFVPNLSILDVLMNISYEELINNENERN